jgi:uncharacterized protein
MSIVNVESVPGPHRPVENRIGHIDSLRGLALFGVILMNVGSMVMMFNARQVFASAGSIDFAAAAVDLVLVIGKARSAFAFLFGAGFAILMMRAQAKGADFRAFYTRRMLALLGFGLVNQVFLFWGDILVSYALLGFALMTFAKWSDAAQVKAGLALVLVPPLLHGLAELILGHPIPGIVQAPADAAARGLAAMTSPDYLDAVAWNIHLGTTRHATDTVHMAVYDLGVLGLFLLGAWSVRTGLLLDPLRHRPLLRRIACWCLPIGLLLSLAYALPFLGARPEGPARAAITAAFVGVPVMAFGYLAAFALLFARSANGLQAILAPAGRMSLTNYLASGAIGSFSFYGWGLGMIDRFNFAGLTALAVALFLVLALFSRFWLSAFPQGPAEWLWRRLSYRNVPTKPGARAVSRGTL